MTALPPSNPDNPAHTPAPRSTASIGPWLIGAAIIIAALLLLGAAAQWWQGSGDSTSSIPGPWHTSFDAGRDAATQSGKPMLVYFGADWCPPCEKMRAEVFSQQRVIDRLADRYVLVHIDLTSRNGPPARIAQRYGVQYLPTTAVIDADGNSRTQMTGFIPADVLLNQLTPEQHSPGHRGAD